MNISTSDGISIHVLPEDARCAYTGIAPDQMRTCPIRNFDDAGLECCPDLCDFYTEGDTDGYM